MRGEPVEDLEELELIVEIVLEPQHYAIELGAHGEPAVARRELVLDGVEIAAAGAREIFDTNGRQLFRRRRDRHRPFMQHVAPGQHLGARQRAAKHLASGIAVGDDEIGRDDHPRPR